MELVQERAPEQAEELDMAVGQAAGWDEESVEAPDISVVQVGISRLVAAVQVALALVELAVVAEAAADMEHLLS